jgi:hypothetical protein
MNYEILFKNLPLKAWKRGVTEFPSMTRIKGKK